MQATSTSALKPEASDQSLALPPVEAERRYEREQYGKRPYKQPVKIHVVIKQVTGHL